MGDTECCKITASLDHQLLTRYSIPTFQLSQDCINRWTRLITSQLVESHSLWLKPTDLVQR